MKNFKEDFNHFEEGLRRYLPGQVITELQKIKIGLAGAGGLGSNCAQMLVRSGFKRFKIIDHDLIDYSNLNRQFYFLDQVGSPKVEALTKNLKQINNWLEIEPLQIKLSRQNICGIFADCQVVVEAFDKAEYKKLIVEQYLNTGKLLVAASGLAGSGNSDDIKVRKINENFYLVGDLVSEAGPKLPPLAPRVHIAAAKQADVILNYFLKQLTKGGVESYNI